MESERARRRTRRKIRIISSSRSRGPTVSTHFRPQQSADDPARSNFRVEESCSRDKFYIQQKIECTPIIYNSRSVKNKNAIGFQADDGEIDVTSITHDFNRQEPK